MRSLAIVAALAGVAHADAWRVTDAPGVLATPKRVCRPEFNEWVVSVASMRPTISADGDHVTFQLNASIMVSTRAVIDKDFLIGFWDQGKGVTLAVRVRPSSKKVEIMFIEHHSPSDRGDACYVEWRGEVERL